MKQYKFEELSNCDLNVDALYIGGNGNHVGDDPISKILKCGNQAGFRYTGSYHNPKFIVLYSSRENIDWPDSIDVETGIYKYYGDNKKPGHELHDTPRKGNLILKNIFESLSSESNPRGNIPPIFIFEKYPTIESNRTVQFKGLCVPGTIQNHPNESLIAIWKTSSGQRFQNYTAYFTILDIGIISRKWINDIINGNIITNNTPKIYLDWINSGKYEPLVSPKTVSIREVEEQLPATANNKILLDTIYQYFKDKPTSFEYMAADIYQMTNKDIIIDEITRTTVDGGRDAIGRLKIGLNDDPIYVNFALEAKLYNPGINGNRNTVGVKEVSRLISRIRNRQFGVLVTTSAIAKQAYTEVREDRHPIIFISGKNIIDILIEKGINSKESLMNFLESNYKL